MTPDGELVDSGETGLDLGAEARLVSLGQEGVASDLGQVDTDEVIISDCSGGHEYSWARVRRCSRSKPRGYGSQAQ